MRQRGLPSAGSELLKPAKCPCQRAVERIAAEDAKADGHHRADGAEEVLHPREGVLTQILGYPDEAKRTRDQQPEGRKDTRAGGPDGRRSTM